MSLIPVMRYPTSPVPSRLPGRGAGVSVPISSAVAGSSVTMNRIWSPFAIAPSTTRTWHTTPR